MIYRWDPRYALAKIFVDTVLEFNFNKLVITGKENIPKGVPLIFAPNHRNALIDALLIVKANPHSKQVVFMGRGDIFKKKLIAWILKGVRIIPVFRIRDGKDNLGRNDEIFTVAGKVLKNNNPVGIFPEANHNPKQSLLPIRKAVPRIVLPTEAQHNFELNSHIVPVSIYYTDVSRLLSECYVHFGEAISVDVYKEDYIENPNVAINKLRGEIEDRLKDIVVDIWNDEYYNEYKSLVDWNSHIVAKELYSSDKEALYKAALHIVRELDELYKDEPNIFEERINDVREAKSILKEYNLESVWRVEDVTTRLILILKSVLIWLSLPLALFGFTNSIIPILIEKKIQRLFKDKQFVSSARYVVGLLFIPIFTLLQSLLILLISNNWLMTCAYFIAMPLSFLFAIHWRKWRKSVNHQWRINRFSNKFPLVWKRLISISKI